MSKTIKVKNYKRTDGTPVSQHTREIESRKASSGTTGTPLYEIKRTNAEIEFGNSNLFLYGIGKKDINGNNIIQVGFPNQRAFSIQTNGVLPYSHNIRGYKLSELSDSQVRIIELELINYIREYGSSKQKQSLKVYEE